MPNMLVLGIAAMVVSYIAVLGLRRLLQQKRIIDIPNERSSHRTPTPRGGGIAIAAIVICGLLVAQLLDAVFPWPRLLMFVISAGLIAVVGWIDDTRSLPAIVRLTVQCLCAVVLVIGWGYWSRVELPIVGIIDLGVSGLPITLFWIVGLTNAYNFMDGIDGLAAGQAVVASGAWIALSLIMNLPGLTLLSTLLIATSLGFLLHNIPPARIFMGDVGSTFLGFAFAALPIMAFEDTNLTRLPIAGLLIMAIFVFDTGLTLIRRAWHRERVFEAHRTHLYQRLVKLGYSHGRVSIIYAALAALASIEGLVYVLVNNRDLRELDAIVVVGILAALLINVIVLERKHESQQNLQI